MTDHDRIKTLLSAYVTERNSFHAHNGYALPPNSITGHEHWNSLCNGYSMQLFAHMPTLNLAELEALSELVNIRLSNIRMML